MARAIKTRPVKARREPGSVRPMVSAVLAPLMAGGVGGLAGMAVSATDSAPAGAATFYGYTNSYYIDTTNASTLATDGCYETGNAVYGPHNVVLDFGAQISDAASATTYGTSTWIVGALPDYQANGPSVLADYKDFANGWRYCSTSVGGWVGLGTNNSAGVITTGSGQDWGGDVSILANDYYGTNIYPRGANDIETGWSQPGPVKNWIGGGNPVMRGGPVNPNGFQGSGQSYFDYGDAGGCSTVCSNSWTDTLVYDKTYGYSGAVSMPEAYYQGQANDWAYVDAGSGSGSPYYSGELSTTGIDTPQTAWQYLGNATGQYTTSTTNIAFM